MMRRFISIVESMLLETPISDMHFYGSDDRPTTKQPEVPFSKGKAFHPVDKKLLSSEKGRSKIVAAFKKTPFNFEIYFLNHNLIDGESDKDNNKAFEETSLLNIDGNILDSFQGIESDENKIKIVVICNLGDLNNQYGRMPMTGWTLAHKIGHGIQTFVFDHYDITGLVTRICKAGEKIAKILSGEENDWREEIFIDTADEHRLKDKEDDYRQFGIGNMFELFMTTGSARKDNITSSVEAFAECIAQFLITGSVKITDNEKIWKFIPQDEKEIVYSLLKDMNNSIYKLFQKMLLGKIMIVGM